MRMVVDDAGHEREAVGVDRLARRAMRFAYRGDPALRDGEVAAPWRRARAIEEQRTAEDEVVHGRLSILAGSMLDLRLDGKVAIVTGGARGIGAATARLFAEHGARVVPLDISTGCDVSDERAVNEAFARAEREHGAIDILVNNAGRANRKPATELSRAEWDAVLELNLTAVFLCSRTAMPSMKRRGGGVIVNLASIMGFSGGIFPNASYQASKGAVVNLTRALALEWAADNIRVNAVAPTFVRTELTTPIFSNAELTARVMQHTPLGRLPEPQEIAAAILFLCSPAARCITGITLPVDSGFLAR